MRAALRTIALPLLGALALACGDAPAIESHGDSADEATWNRPPPLDLPRLPPLDVTRATSSWSTPATLQHSACFDEGSGRCGGGIPQRQTITFDDAAIQRQQIFPSQKVRFGPFKLVNSIRYYQDPNPGEDPEPIPQLSVDYKIEIWARTGALYAGGTFKGADAKLVKLTGHQETVQGNKATKEIYVTATLPSVFSAIQIRASIGNQKQSYPVGCGDLPPESTNPSSLDKNCLRAGVNPLARLEVPWMPVAIVYDPPGNCSWSALTNEAVAGVSLSVGLGSSTSTHTINDSGAIASSGSSDITVGTETAKTKFVRARLENAERFGSRLSGSTQSPGNPRCNDPEADVAPRLDGGPGRGDLFVLMKNPSFAVWDSGGVLTGINPDPSKHVELLHIYGDDLQAGRLPPFVTMTPETRDAILSLDPFTANAAADLKTNDRFVKIGNKLLGPRAALEHTIRSVQESGGSDEITQSTTRLLSETQKDSKVSFTLAGLSFAINSASGGATGDLLGKIEGALGSLTPSTKTTVTTTFTSNRFLDATNSNAVTEQFFLQDTRDGLNVEIYYDKLFGTYAFRSATSASP